MPLLLGASPLEAFLALTGDLVLSLSAEAAVDLLLAGEAGSEKWAWACGGLRWNVADEVEEGGLRERKISRSSSICQDIPLALRQNRGHTILETPSRPFVLIHQTRALLPLL